MIEAKDLYKYKFEEITRLGFEGAIVFVVYYRGLVVVAFRHSLQLYRLLKDGAGYQVVFEGNVPIEERILQGSIGTQDKQVVVFLITAHEFLQVTLAEKRVEKAVLCGVKLPAGAVAIDLIQAGGGTFYFICLSPEQKSREYGLVFDTNMLHVCEMKRGSEKFEFRAQRIDKVIGNGIFDKSKVLLTE
jgi:hypothetical protein